MLDKANAVPSQNTYSVTHGHRTNRGTDKHVGFFHGKGGGGRDLRYLHASVGDTWSRRNREADQQDGRLEFMVRDTTQSGC